MTALDAGCSAQILSPLQGAKACVGLYPWLPDKLAILNCVAAAASQPSAANIVLGTDRLDCSYQPEI